MSDERLQQIEQLLAESDFDEVGHIYNDDVRWLCRALCDARAEVERLSDRDHWRVEWEDADAKRITAEHELAAERAKVQRISTVHVWTNEDGKQFLFADDVRAALAGKESDV